MLRCQLHRAQQPDHAVLDGKLLDSCQRRLRRKYERTEMSAALVGVTGGQSSLPVAGK